MAYIAANAVPVASNWSQAATFAWPYGIGAVKLDAFVNGTDVVLQVLEEQTGFQDDVTQEILLRMGFNSREFPTPFLKWRFKVWSGTLLAPAGTVDMAVMS